MCLLRTERPRPAGHLLIAFWMLGEVVAAARRERGADRRAVRDAADRLHPRVYSVRVRVIMRGQHADGRIAAWTRRQCNRDREIALSCGGRRDCRRQRGQQHGTKKKDASHCVALPMQSWDGACTQVAFASSSYS